MYKIIHADCLEEMNKMSDNSIDFIVTDPPYGFNFMGKKWDSKVPNIEIWKEALRICKPGSMLAAFGGSRTHHHLMIALEQAGWEIRDVIMWLYGQGFPKSLDISKAIDKAKGLNRKVIGIKPGHKGFENNNSHSLNGEWSRPWTLDQEKVNLYHSQTEANSDLAKTFSGYGTALKPAYEPIIIAMKPLEGTFAQNAEKWGLGGINIDDCRIETSEEKIIVKGTKSSGGILNRVEGKRISEYLAKGRWPANIILDQESGEFLDEQTGILKSGSGVKNPIGGATTGFHTSNWKDSGYREGDSGGASRFFYCAKASNKERGELNNHPTVKPISLMKYIIQLLAPPNNPTLLDPFAGSGTTLLAALELKIKCIGIEKELEYIEIIKKRLNNDIQYELFA